MATSLFKLLPVFSLGDCKHPCQGERLLMAAALTQVDVQETQAGCRRTGWDRAKTKRGTVDVNI